MMSSPAVCTHVFVAEFGSESVLLNTRSGLYFSLNESGLAIWKMLEANHSIDDIASQLVSSFEVTRTDALADIRTFLSALEASELVQN